MKKFDVGITDKEMYGTDAPVESSKTRIIRPSFSLIDKQLPVLKGKKFDEHFTMECDVRIESIRSEEDKDTKITYEIELLKIGLKGGKISDDEFDKLSEKDKAKSMRKSVGLNDE